MEARYLEYDRKWLFDSIENKLYDIVENTCVPCKFDIMQLTKFCPYAELTASYDNCPYEISH